MSRKKMSGKGFASLVQIMSALKHRERTVMRLHKALQPDVPQMIPLSRTVRRLYDAGLLHIGGWEPPQRGVGQPSRIYTFGPGEDAPPPTRTNGKPSGMANKMKPLRPHGGAWNLVERFASLWAALDGVPMSAVDIAAESGVGERDVRKALRAMHEAHPKKLVRIADWKRGDVAEPTALYQLGAHDDMPRPTPLSKHEYYLRRVEKNRARALHQLLSFLPPKRPVAAHPTERHHADECSHAGG